MRTGRFRTPETSARSGEPRRNAGGAKAGRWFLVALAIALAPAVRIFNEHTLVGGTIEAVFDAASVGQTARSVSVRVDRTTRTRVFIDFGRLE